MRRTLTTLGHEKKLSALAEQAQKPLRSIGNTVHIIGDLKPPQYVIDIFSLGPKHPVLIRFDEISFLADYNRCLSVISTSSSADKIHEMNALGT